MPVSAARPPGCCRSFPSACVGLRQERGCLHHAGGAGGGKSADRAHRAVPPRRTPSIALNLPRAQVCPGRGRAKSETPACFPFCRPERALARRRVAPPLLPPRAGIYDLPVLARRAPFLSLARPVLAKRACLAPPLYVQEKGSLKMMATTRAGLGQVLTSWTVFSHRAPAKIGRNVEISRGCHPPAYIDMRARKLGRRPASSL